MNLENKFGQSVIFRESTVEVTNRHTGETIILDKSSPNLEERIREALDDYFKNPMADGKWMKK